MEKAKLKMLDGEAVTITFWRNNKEHQTKIAMDMDALAAEQESEIVFEKEDDNLVGQLAELADLFEKGLPTEEEYNAAKGRLLE